MPGYTVHDVISPAVTDTTASIASRRPGGTSRASTSRSTGAPGSCASTTALSGSRSRRCANTKSVSYRSSAATSATAARISSAVIGSSGCELAHFESARCWRMYSAVPDTKPSTLFAFPVT